MNYSTTRHPITKVFGISWLKAIFLAVSLICFVVLIILEKREEYIAIVSLPFSFFVISLFINFKKHLWGTGGVVIWAMYFLRYTVFPVIIVMGQYRFDAPAEVYELYFNKACWLMNLELLVVSIVFCLFSSYLLKKEKKKVADVQQQLPIAKNTDGYFAGKKLFYSICGIFLAFNIVVYIMYPSLLSLYWRFIFFEQDRVARLAALNELIAVIPGYIYYPFKLTTEFLKIVIIVWLVIKITNSELNTLIKFLLVGILAVISISFISSEQINSIILCFVIYLYLIFKYLKYSKLFVVFGLVGVIAGFAIVMRSIADVEDMQGFGRIINDYFNGPINVACSIGLKNEIDFSLSYVFTDILNEIPLLERLTDADSTNTLFNEFYNLKGAIIPMVGYGYIYFGYIGAALPSLTVIVTVQLLDKIADNMQADVLKLIFLYLTVHIAMAVGMYNILIYYSLWIYELLVPLFLTGASRFLGDKKVRGQIRHG